MKMATKATFGLSDTYTGEGGNNSAAEGTAASWTHVVQCSRGTEARRRFLGLLLFPAAHT